MEIWEEHDQLFHYTTQQGLKGILETQSLHATHFAFMNDSTEMFQMKQKLEDMFLRVATNSYKELAASDQTKSEEMAAAGGIQELAQHDALATVRVLYGVTFGVTSKPKFFQPFVVSFCGHKEEYERKNGLLSLWRAYGKDSGYAIVLDTKALVDQLRTECDRYLYDFWGVGDIIYDGDETVFNKEFIDAVDLDGPRLLKGEDMPYTALNNAFIKHVPRYKHYGFREEQEVRIVISPTDGAGIEMLIASGKYDQQKHKKKKTVKFKGSLTPYIALFDDSDVKLPIEQIIVGPHADKGKRRDKLEKYLELSGLKIGVSCSETPLV